MKILPTRSDEKIFQIIRIIVFGFSVIGLAPFSLGQTKKSARNSRTTNLFLSSKVRLAHNVLLSIVGVVLSLFAIPHAFSLSYPNKSSMTQAIDVVQGILRTSSGCFIIIFWAFGQKRAVSIMNRLLAVDSLLSGTNNNPRSAKALFISISAHVIFDALVWITFWVTEVVYVRSFMDFFTVNVPIFLIHWFVVEYSIIVGIVARELKSSNDSLTNFKEFPNRSVRSPMTNDRRVFYHNLPTHHCLRVSALELLHGIRTRLSTVCHDITDFFSLPILAAVACFSLALIYNFYYIIIPVIISSGTDIPIAAHINAVAWILVCVYPLILLCYNVTETLEEAEQTGLVVHKLLITTTERRIQDELERFSLELIHEELSFTACGFFALDFTLVQSIFGATVTYLVIIIQFMVSANSTYTTASLGHDTYLENSTCDTDTVDSQ